MRSAALVLLVALAACGDPAPRQEPLGQKQRVIVDEATAAYAACLSDGAKTVALSDAEPGDVVAKIVEACKPKRDALVTAIEDFNQIGYPNRSAEQLAAVAEGSIQAIEPSLRAEAVGIYVGRIADAQKGK
jgi:hypothetical protein